MKKRVLAVSSGGGHWVQLLRLQPAWSDCDVAYATVHAGSQASVPGARFYKFIDATRWDRWRLVLMTTQLALLLLRERPDIVVSTGAAPGYIALRLGRMMGARTIWLDSIANVEELSLSGRKVGNFADLWLTQWEHLATQDGPAFKGAVL